MAGIFDTLPFRAVRGFFRGMEHGAMGKVDTNTRFSDGVWTDDPAKKSAAGRFLSEKAGINGGHSTGKFIGKWTGALIGAGFAAVVFFNPVMLAVGLGPTLLAIGTGAVAAGLFSWAGANIGAVVGRTVGSVAGAVVGGALGAVTGTFNAIFKRGYYSPLRKQDPQTPEPQTPQEAKAQPGKQQEAEQDQASSVGLPGQEKVQAHTASQQAAPGQQQQTQQGRGIGKWLGIGAAAMGAMALVNRFSGKSQAKPNAQTPPESAEPTVEAEVEAENMPIYNKREPQRQEERMEAEQEQLRGDSEVKSQQPVNELPDPVVEFEAHREDKAHAEVDRLGDEIPKDMIGKPHSGMAAERPEISAKPERSGPSLPGQ